MKRMKEEYKEIVCGVPNTDCRFKYAVAGKGIRMPLGNDRLHCLVFALEGKLKINFPGMAPGVLSAGCFVLLPGGRQGTAIGMQPGRYVCFLFNGVDQVWTSVKIRRLLDACPATKPQHTSVPAVVTGQPEGDKKESEGVAGRQQAEKGLPIRHPLDSFLQLIALYLEEPDLDRSFYSGKDIELLALLYTFYAPEELGPMFYPVLTGSLDFRSFVEANYLKVENASQLAELAGCSLVTLNRKFREHFNDTAYQWLIKNKRVSIKKRLQTTVIPLSEVAREFGFYSGSELNRFCQRQFGVSALKLRKAQQQNKQRK